MSNQLTVGSLFSGIGGFDIAAERSNMKVLWQSEVDRYASIVLEHHWPWRNLGDVHDIRIRRDEPEGESRDLTVSEDREGFRGLHIPDGGTNDGTNSKPAPAVDVLVGGFPCQSYSVAGNRGGLAEDRGALWWEFHRLIREGQPTWVVGENVPGLLSSAGGRDFATIIRSLVQLGYGVVWRVLDAQYFGVPQRRRRVIIVGHSGGLPRPEVLALSEGMCGYPEPSREEGEIASAFTRNGIGGGGRPDDNSAQADRLIPFRQQRSSDYIRDDIASTIARRDYKSATDLIAFTQNQRNEVRDLNDKAGALAAEPGMKQQTFVVHATQDHVVAEDGNTHALGGNSQQAVMFPIAFSSKDYGADATDDLAPTLRAGNHVTSHQNGGIPPAISSPQVRRLTPLECQRLQGFPDDWYQDIKMSDTQKYRQLGNAVAVPVAEWVMDRVARYS